MFKIFKKFKQNRESSNMTCEVSEEGLYKELDKLSTETLELLYDKICGNQ